MAYIDQFGLSDDLQFRKRVEIAIVTVARDIASEAPATANHAARATLAKAVANNPVGFAALFAVGCAVQRADATPGTDADLFSAVSALWNLYAGVV